MKKILALILVCAAIFCLAACGNKEDGGETTGTDRVLDNMREGSLYDEDGKVELLTDGFKATFKDIDGTYLVVIFKDSHGVEAYRVHKFDSKEDAKAEFDEIKGSFAADEQYSTINKVDNYIIYKYNPMYKDVRDFFTMDMGKVIQKVGLDKLVK